MPTFKLSGFKRKNQERTAIARVVKVLLQRRFELTMTLRGRFCKLATTDTNHRALREHAQETRDTRHTLPYPLYDSGKWRAVALSLKMKDRCV